MRGAPSIFVFDGAEGLDSGLGPSHPPQHLRRASPRDRMAWATALGLYRGCWPPSADVSLVSLNWVRGVRSLSIEALQRACTP